MMIIASPAMMDSYNRFGEMISFDITYNLLRNITHDNHRFRVGIFTVGDTNQRILFAGLAFRYAIQHSRTATNEHYNRRSAYYCARHRSAEGQRIIYRYTHARFMASTQKRTQ
jgi:hypothetical protein